MAGNEKELTFRDAKDLSNHFDAIATPINASERVKKAHAALSDSILEFFISTGVDATEQ